MKIKHLFLVSSAIETKFGYFSAYGRLRQVLFTCKSILKYVPEAKIVIIESSSTALSEDQLKQLKEVTHYVANFSGNENLKKLHDDNVNWDFVKSASEISCFNRALSLVEESGLLDDIDRIHKISGRYQLNSNFNPYIYEVEKNKIIVAQKKPSQYKDNWCDIQFQYMSRLWSWPNKYHGYIKEFYQTAINEIVERAKEQKFADIEHLMYKHLDPKKILEVQKIGIEGLIAGNAIKIDD